MPWVISMFACEEIEKSFKSFVKRSTNESFKVALDDKHKRDYHMSFNYIIEGNYIIGDYNNPTFKISNLNIFIQKLTVLINLMAKFHLEDKEYFEFSENNFLDYLLVSCFSNMSESDLNFPLSYLDRQINAYSRSYNFEDVVVGSLNLKEKNILVNSVTKKNRSTMEAPLYTQFYFSYNGEKYLLPKIHYYIVNNKCYIMGIQNGKNKQDNTLSKNMSRYLRKLDKGLDDISQSENGEVLTEKDISPSFLAALILFISSNKNISSFYFPDYLPLRYINKVGVLNDKGEDIAEADRIQTNVTNKLLLTASRVGLHFDNSEISLNSDGFLQLQFNSSQKNKANIITDLYNSISLSSKKTK